MLIFIVWNHQGLFWQLLQEHILLIHWIKLRIYVNSLQVCLTEPVFLQGSGGFNLDFGKSVSYDACEPIACIHRRLFKALQTIWFLDLGIATALVEDAPYGELHLSIVNITSFWLI